MKKKHKIILLEIENYPAILKSTCNVQAFGHKHEKMYGWYDCGIRTPHDLNHLYILSDDKINENDWIYNEFSVNKIRKTNKFNNSSDKKIIATTDSQLIINSCIDPNKPYLASISKEFIEKYVNEHNNGNIITEIELEYKERYSISDYSSVNDTYPDGLKLNHNNEVIIKLIEEKLYTRKEVLEKCVLFGDYVAEKCTGQNIKTIGEHEWLEKNI